MCVYVTPQVIAAIYPDTCLQTRSCGNIT